MAVGALGCKTSQGVAYSDQSYAVIFFFSANKRHPKMISQIGWRRHPDSWPLAWLGCVLSWLEWFLIRLEWHCPWFDWSVNDDGVGAEKAVFVVEVGIVRVVTPEERHMLMIMGVSAAVIDFFSHLERLCDTRERINGVIKHSKQETHGSLMATCGRIADDGMNAHKQVKKWCRRLRSLLSLSEM